ncbi:hypothetical protein Gpo141_00000060 [Globisporangium polare]
MLRSRSTPAEIAARVKGVRYELFRGTRIRVLEIGFGRHRDHLMKELRSADRRDLEQRCIAVQLRRTGPRELAHRGLRLALHETEPVHQMERDHLERGDDLGVGEDLLPELMSDLTSDLHMEDTTWQHSIQDLIVPPVAVIEPYRYEGSIGATIRAVHRRLRAPLPPPSPGVHRVRIITDAGWAKHSSSEVQSFIRADIAVKFTNSTMHNKFFVVDRRVDITGSLNYSKSGVAKNHERVQIHRDGQLVADDVFLFCILWAFHADHLDDNADEDDHLDEENGEFELSIRPGSPP